MNKYKMNHIKKWLKECYNIILNLDLMLMKWIKILTILNLNKFLKMNLILEKDQY